MTHEELEETVPLYAAGALDRAERQALEAHLLSGCPSCHNALKDYQSAASLLPFGLTPVQPPRGLKAKIMAERDPVSFVAENVQDEPAPPSLEGGDWMKHLFPPIAPARSFTLPWALGFATLAIAGLAAYFYWNYTARLSDSQAKLQQLETSLQDKSVQVARLQREQSERQQALANLQAEVDRKAAAAAELREQIIARDTELEGLRQQTRIVGPGQKGVAPQDELAVLMRKPNVRIVSLAGTDMAKTASAFLLYDASSKKVWLYAVNLPECLNGTVYQLWGIDQKPKSIGMFHMDSGESAHLLVTRINDFEKTKRFAVSLEPPGGRLQPTGPIYLSGHST